MTSPTPAPVAIITGASSGIGEAAARIFAQAGYRVVLAARRVERLEALDADITAAGGEAIVAELDVAQLDTIQAMVEQTLQAYGQIDVLLNNAGFGRFKWLEDLEHGRDIDTQVEVNILGVIHTSRAVLPHMLERQTGHIINMASMAGFIGTPTYSIYAACKHAVRGFTEALRREVGVYNIHVSAIYPGGVATEFSSHTETERKTGITTPKALLLTPQQVGEAVLKVAQGRRSRTVVMPWVMRFSIWLNFFFPRLNDWIIERTFTRPERGL